MPLPHHAEACILPTYPLLSALSPVEQEQLGMHLDTLKYILISPMVD